MSDREIMPSALPAEYAERASDRPDPDALPWRRPTVDSLLASTYKLREQIDLRDRTLYQWRRGIEDVIAILKEANK